MMQVSLLSTFFDKQTTKDNRPFYAMEENDFFSYRRTHLQMAVSMKQACLSLKRSIQRDCHSGLVLVTNERTHMRPCFSGLEYWK